MCKNLFEELQLDGVVEEELHGAGPMVDKHILVEGDGLALEAQRSENRPSEVLKRGSSRY